MRKIGSDVPRSPMNLNEGDPVLLSIAFCGACPSCQAGHPSYCYDAYGLNFAHPGCDSYQVIAAPGQDTASPVVGGFLRPVKPRKPSGRKCKLHCQPGRDRKIPGGTTTVRSAWLRIPDRGRHSFEPGESTA